MKIVLYKLDAKKLLRVWSISSYKRGYTTRAGLFKGNFLETDHPVLHGLASRTRKEQIISKIESTVNKRIRGGWCKSKKKAKKGVRNSLGFKIQMKAQRIDKQSSIDWETTFVQRKYDGHHCSIVCHKGKNIAYSSGGKRIKTINHIIKKIKIPEGRTVDGELYLHGLKLQKISKLVKKEQEFYLFYNGEEYLTSEEIEERGCSFTHKKLFKTSDLQFICYDIMDDANYYERMFMIRNHVLFCKNSLFADTVMCKGKFDVEVIRDKFIEEGYEGAILRQNKYPYEDGKRSKGVLKVKRFFDDEFEVVKIIKSVDGYGILVCTCDAGEFKCTAPGAQSEKLEVARNKNDYIGKFINVKYPELTARGIPSQPVAEYWRDKEDE